MINSSYHSNELPKINLDDSVFNSHYYLTPRDYILQKIQIILEQNSTEIPLQLTQDKNQFDYLSAVGVKLAARSPNSPEKIVEQILTEWSTKFPESLQYFSISSISSGLLLWKIHDIFLAQWLQFLIKITLPSSQLLSSTFLLKSEQLKPSFSQLFPLQYTHARCCSLLRLADQENLINLEINQKNLPSLLPNSSQNLLNFSSIPWLNQRKILLFNHPLERHLIHYFLLILDRLAPNNLSQISPQKVIKIGHEFTQIFDQFYRKFPFFGDHKINFPQENQARLGLVLITQKLLHFILEDLLQIYAPLSL